MREILFRGKRKDNGEWAEGFYQPVNNQPDKAFIGWYETKEQMLETVRYVCNSHIHGIKLQLLHILKDTDLADFYIEHKDESNVFACIEQEAYFSVIKDCLPLIPDDMVVYRLTGDGPKRSLLAPLWSADKKRVLNALQQIRKDTKRCNQKC